MTFFSLSWYIVVGVQAAINTKLVGIAYVAKGVIGPNADHYFIALAAERLTKQFV